MSAAERTVASYRVLVGLEIHVQLATATKLFTAAPDGATDNGVGLPAGLDLEGAPGIGVRNTRARLDLLHGPAAAVGLGAGDDGRGTTAELVVPLARASR